MFDTETAALLEGGSSLIVGSVAPDGTPHACRAWGVTVLPGDPPRLRVLIDAADTTAAANLDGEGAMALTAADVRTLHTIQVKGRVEAVEPATFEDRARATRFQGEFFGAVVRTDGTDPALLERLAPREYVACTLAVEQLFDQTPGPGAGAALAPPT